MVASPAIVGMNAATLCALGPAYERHNANIHSILVARNGKLVFERYFAAADGRPWSSELIHNLASATKSITALVLGAALDRGWVEGIDVSALSFFPEYADLRTPEKDAITLRHLLTSSQGLAWDSVRPLDRANSDWRMVSAGDPYRFVFEQRVASPPGQTFTYNSASTAIIGAVLKKKTGRKLDDLARELLFEPLGITEAFWQPHHSGDPRAYMGLQMRPRDFAKIGQLVLARGRWHGKQVIPAEWIETATTKQQVVTGYAAWTGYGFQFWIGRFYHQKFGETDWAAALGYAGQLLYIVPSLDVVVAINADIPPALQPNVPRTILDRYVLASIETR